MSKGYDERGGFCDRGLGGGGGRGTKTGKETYCERDTAVLTRGGKRREMKKRESLKEGEGKEEESGERMKGRRREGGRKRHD